jgi:hypothetical protein
MGFPVFTSMTPAEPYAPPNVPWPETQRQAADSLAVLTAAAVATEQVRLAKSPVSRAELSGLP